MDVGEHRVTSALRGLLLLLIVPAFLLALDALVVGLFFGSALWDASNPTPTLLWLGVLAAPVLMGVAGKKGGSSPVVLALAIAIGCALDSPYLVAAFSH